MKRSTPIYIAHTLPGFEPIAAEEITAELEGAAVRSTSTVADKNGMVLFTYDGDPADMLALRTVEDIFVQVAVSHEFAPTYAALRSLREYMEKVQLEPQVALARQLKPGRGGQGKLRFRVVSRVTGQTHFRRVDAQEAVEKGLAARTDRRWTRSDENALEFWLTILPGSALLALRLSDETMRHRDYKLEHVPASLRPAGAAAMVRLTRPKDDDVFLDPMCGAGTILIERAHAGRYAQLLGGDDSREAVSTTLANIGPRYKPIRVEEWDARSLPIDADSITAAAVNLPFGKQYSSPEENRQLYPAFTKEMERVLLPGARLALLTGDWNTLEDSLKRTRRLMQRSSHRVWVLGAPARLLVVQKV